MKAEFIVSSSYEAAWCQLKGLTCQMIPTSGGDDVDYVFEDSKALREARRQFEEEVDLQEFIEGHRRLKWSVKKALQDYHIVSKKRNEGRR